MNEEKTFPFFSLIPKKLEKNECADLLENSALFPYISRMSETFQQPDWHGEGDVLSHTLMVCQALIEDKEFGRLDPLKQMIVYTAAVFHDIGKIRCTKTENGRLISPNHALIGSKEARAILWKDFGLCGSETLRNIRECICTLIRFHTVPVHGFEKDNCERMIMSIAAMGELIPSFSLDLLRILVRADIKGRICDDHKELLESSELFFMLAEELGAFKAPVKFPSDTARRAYFLGKTYSSDTPWYDNSWGEIILLSGLPGTGKDYLTEKFYGDIPMVSLDKIRESKGISPTDPQRIVADEAKELSKKFLREKQPFVFNATNITSIIRKKNIDLFEQYGARVRTIFLETDWNTERTRNRSREKAVPEHAVEKMLDNLEPPQINECAAVEWKCV